MMQCLTNPQDMHLTRDSWRGCRVALVPTMGNLHAGHLSLVESARQHADKVVVSVFVNPAQFEPYEDFECYPRTEEADLEKLRRIGVDAAFLPQIDSLMPANNHTWVHVAPLSSELCGKTRPHHFRGVATIVNKLINIVQPDAIALGEKDYQQLICIRHMLHDLCLPVTLIAVPILRDTDGLALSSRNQYLSCDERKIAPYLHQTLLALGKRLKSGERNYAMLCRNAEADLCKHYFVPDYVTIRTPNLAMPTAQSESLVILAAARLGKTRLIDNLKLTSLTTLVTQHDNETHGCVDTALID